MIRSLNRELALESGMGMGGALRMRDSLSYINEPRS
jgi:hypothetical protein